MSSAAPSTQSRGPRNANGAPQSCQRAAAYVSIRQRGSSPAFEVRHLVSLVVGAVLGAREFLLRLALALLLAALAPERRVVGQIAGRLLCRSDPPCGSRPVAKCYPGLGPAETHADRSISCSYWRMRRSSARRSGVVGTSGARGRLCGSAGWGQGNVGTENRPKRLRGRRGPVVFSGRYSPRRIASARAMRYRPVRVRCSCPSGDSRLMSSRGSRSPGRRAGRALAACRCVFYSTMQLTTRPSEPICSSWPRGRAGAARLCCRGRLGGRVRGGLRHG